jgi:lipopolysaccharide export system protein LptC
VRLTFKNSLGVVLPAAAVVVAWAASTQVSTDKPIINFSLPTFTADGHRSWLVRGSEARIAGQNIIDVRGLTLSIFSGKADEKVETMILSPKARVLPGESIVTGEDTIRVINDQFEANGSDWRYAHNEKRVNIAKNVRVVFNSELKDFLK